MTDVQSVISSYGLIIATAGLVFATLTLAIHSSRLVKATFELAASTKYLGLLSIRPALSLSGQQGLVRQDDHKTVRFTVKGRGEGVAVITGITGKHLDGRPIVIKADTEGRPALANSEVFTWDAHGIERDEKFIITVEYEDIDGNKMKPWTLELAGLWNDA